jgi:hypothetical protein
MASDEHLQAGTILLGKYRVEHVLGTGGMAVVIAATHVHLLDRVAIKVLLPELAAAPEVAMRFLREAQAAVRLKGEHVARVIDVGALASGLPYIVMEHLDGHDLAAEIARRGPLPAGEAVDHVLQVCEAMAEAHGLGIVHRDLKPANCFLTRRPGGSPLVKVLDFGISKAPVEADHQLTRTHAVMGTPAYMSPEQLRASRDVDARSDIWSLGVVLHECLTGRRPFDGDTLSAVCLKVAVDPLPPLPAYVARELAAVVERCLAKEPAARFATVGELAAALAPFAGDRAAAQAVVERARAMVAGVAGVVSAASPVTAASAAPTTLGGSAGVMTRPATGRRPRWWWLAVAAAAGGVVLWLGLQRRAASTAAAPSAPARPAQEPSVAHPVDAGPVDAGPVDAGPVDAGPVDAGPVDAGASDALPAVPARPGSSPARPRSPARERQAPNPLGDRT